MSAILSVEDRSLIHAILGATHQGRMVEVIRSLGGGAVNAVYAAEVGGTEVVLRLADKRYRAGEHEMEAWCMERAAAAGVPGPKVLAVGEWEGTVYMVQELLHGRRGDDPVLYPAVIWSTLGSYARLIHAIDPAGFPDRTDSSPDWPRRKWDRYVSYGIESLTPEDPLMLLGVYPSSRQAEIRSIFQALGKQQFRFGLYHGDLSEPNAIVSAGGVVHLLDWGCAGVGVVPHAEIAAIFRWFGPEDARFQAFLAGYGLSAAEFAPMVPQISDFRLLQSFDLVRWSIDRRPEELPDYTARARQTLEERAR